jgi:hypothetical protein
MQCSHLHSFRTAGVASGLATNVNPTRVSRGGWKSLLHEDVPAANFIFIQQIMIVRGLRVKWYTLYLPTVVYRGTSKCFGSSNMGTVSGAQ